MYEATHLQEESPAETSQLLQALDQRLNRLEHAVAALQDTRGLEERISLRMAERLRRTREAGRSGLVIDASRPLLPAPVPSESTSEALRSPVRAGWLLFDLYSEFRCIVGMYVDRRYRLSWGCRLAPVVFACLVLLSWMTLGNLPLVGWFLDKVFDVVLVVVTYKILSREARRYCGMIAASTST
jgi:hypothetical protein